MTQINDKSQSGFSLLEVLIALLILSIGLLGIAGLQVTSKRTNFEAIQRTTATMLARDMIERMRANPSQFAVYTNNGDGWAFIPSAAITTADTDCFDVTCNAGTIALYDMFEWENAILGITEVSGGGANTGGLVTPTACITAPAAPAPAGSVVIAIAYRGLVKLPDQPAPGKNACGNDTGLYDDTGGDNAFRRVIELQTFINTT